MLSGDRDEMLPRDEMLLLRELIPSHQSLCKHSKLNQTLSLFRFS